MLPTPRQSTLSSRGQARERRVGLEAAARGCIAQTLRNATRDVFGERVLVVSARASADLQRCIDRYARAMRVCGETRESTCGAVSHLLDRCVEDASVPTTLHRAVWRWVEAAWNDGPATGLYETFRTIYADGSTWLVHEVAENDWRPRPVLVFESELVMRAVNHYPLGWHDLGDDELYAVSWEP